MGPAVSAVVSAAVAALVTALAVPLARWAGRRFGWMDPPDGDRKSHGAPVPVTGGWPLLAGLAAGLAVLGPMSPRLLAGGGLVFALGWAEDLGRRRGRSLPVVARLTGQVAVSAWALSEIAPTTLALIALVVWTVALLNAANFVDGLDGLVSGVGAVAAASLALIATLSGGVPLAAALAGSLTAVHVGTRAPSPRLFLGDSGSLVVGYAIAVATASLAVNYGPSQAAAAALVCGVLVTEAVVTVARRARSGRPVWRADAEHLHHRLARTEGPDRAVVRILWFGVFFACVGVASLALPGTWALAGVGVGVAAGAVLARHLYAAGV